MLRPFRILNSTLPRQSGRLDLALYRAVFILFVTLVVLIIQSNYGSMPKVNFGRLYLTNFERASIFLLAILAGRLNRETVGDTTSGFLSLICLSGTKSSAWTLVRLFQIWAGFLSVWIVRLPFLLLFFTLGGARFPDIIEMEVLLLFVFAAASSRTMLVAHHAEKQSSSDWAGLGTIFMVEISLVAGRFLIVLLSLINVKTPVSFVILADQLAEISLYVRLQTFGTGAGIGVSLRWSVLIYMTLTLYWLIQYQFQLYQQIGESPQPMLEGKKDKKKSLKSRVPLARCWDDALAWQSYVYYAGGRNNTTGRVVLYGISFLIVCIIVSTSYLNFFLGLILVVSGAVLINVMNTPAHCMDKETKSKTLSSLALTPHSGVDLYHGWKRGMWTLAIPDFIYVALLSIVTFFLNPVYPLVIVSIALTLLVSGPLLILSHLVPVSLRGFGTGMFVVFGLMGVMVVGGLGGTFLSPVAFPFVAIPLYWGFNQILLKAFVEKWMQIKIDTEV